MTSGKTFGSGGNFSVQQTRTVTLRLVVGGVWYLDASPSASANDVRSLCVICFGKESKYEMRVVSITNAVS